MYIESLQFKLTQINRHVLGCDIFKNVLAFDSASCGGVPYSVCAGCTRAAAGENQPRPPRFFQEKQVKFEIINSRILVLIENHSHASAFDLRSSTHVRNDSQGNILE